MADLLMHDKYVGSAEFSAEDEVFHGKLLGIRGLVTYEAENAKELKAAFIRAIEDYLATCAAQGKAPEIPFKGGFNVRTGMELHRRAAVYAEQHGKKLNAVVVEALDSYLTKHT